MSERKQIQKVHDVKKKKEKQRKESIFKEEGEQETRQVSTEISATNDLIDDILSDFTGAQDKIETVGTKKDRPQLRKESSAEFIKAFRQRQGQ